MSLPAATIPDQQRAADIARRAPDLLIALAIIVGLGLRWSHLGAQSLWFDEGYTAWMVNHPAGEILRLVRADTSPPFYYLLLRAWTLAGGSSEFALRAFSAVLGSASLAFVGLSAWQILRSRWAVAMSVWLFALSPLQVEFCREARGYELAAFLTAGAFYALLRWSDTGRWGWLVAAVLSCAAGLYTHNIMLPYAVALAVAAILLPSRLTPVRRTAALNLAPIAVLILYAPWFVVLSSQMRSLDQGFWVPAPTLRGFAATLDHLAGVVPMWSWDRFVPGFSNDGIKRAAITWIFFILLLATILLALSDRDRPRRRTLAALAAAALLPPILAAIYSAFGTSIFLDKAFLGSTTLLPILLAAPLARLDTRFDSRFESQDAPSRPLRLAAMILPALFLPALFLLGSAATVYGVKRESIKEDWRSAAAHVAALPAVHHRLILFDANDGQLPFDYYYKPRPGDVETGVPDSFFDLNPPRTMRRVLKPSDLAGLQQRLAEHPWDDVLLILSHTGWSDPDGRTESYLRQAATPAERWQTHDVTIERFRPGRSAP